MTEEKIAANNRNAMSVSKTGFLDQEEEP